MNIRRAITIIERVWFFIKLPILTTVLLSILHTFVLTIFFVDGVSMESTLKDGQILLINKLVYLFNSPQVGDIVILQFPGDPERRMFVKRIVGTPMQTIRAGSRDYYGEISSKEVTLGQGEYFVLGDNREQSGDSRIWGTVPRENIIGKSF